MISWYGQQLQRTKRVKVEDKKKRMRNQIQSLGHLHSPRIKGK